MKIFSNLERESPGEVNLFRGLVEMLGARAKLCTKLTKTQWGKVRSIMAESQGGFSYNAQALSALQTIISSRRFARYLQRAPNPSVALQWYLYNARVAKSLLFPLHIFEIALRNSFDQVLEMDYGPDWPRSTAFENALNREGSDALQKSISRVGKKKTSPTKNDILAELTLDFWASLFRPEYTHRLWTAKFHMIFPNLSHAETVADVRRKVVGINDLRNRIAHHEPIFDSPNLVQRYQDVLALLKAQNKIAFDWVSRHSTFNKIQRTQPAANGVVGPTVGSRCDTAFYRLPLTTKLSVVGPKACVLCFDAANIDVAVVLPAHVAVYALGVSINSGDMIDFSDHCLSQVVNSGGLTGNFFLVDDHLLLSDLADAFRQNNKNIAIVENRQTKTTRGYILRAHRHY